MKHQNHLLKRYGTVLSRTLLCSTLTCAPLLGVQTMMADTSQMTQTHVRGTVVDENGEPIIGANIMVVGGKATQGTISDMDGNFQINAKAGTKIKVSYVGFESQTLTVKNGMRITMVEDSKTTLKGVEVVAYGVQKKVSVTGALSSVKGEDLVRTPVGSVNNVLGGQLSGVTTVQYSGEPGSDAASVFVRGQASFNDANPLVQVDGVERSMSDIDPEEIESITVLKDASATAVFGVRGANGVILITTKRGIEGKTRISGSTSWGVLTPTKMVDQANSYEYATFHNLMSDLDGVKRQFSDVVVQKFKDGSDPIRFPNTRWTDYIMKSATLQSKHNLNISGGTKKARYFINVGYYTQGGLFKEFGQDYHFDYRYNRFNYRANLDLDLTKTTTLSFNLAGNVGNANKPYTGQGSSGMIEAAYEATPFSSPGIIDGHYISTDTQYDDCGTDQLPFVGGSGITYFGNANVSGGFMKTTTNKLTFDLQLVQKLDFITKGLSFKVKGSYNGTYNIYKNGYAAKATYIPFLLSDGTMGYKKNGNEEQLTYSESTSRDRYWYFETSLSYNRQFGDHHVGGLLLYNQDSNYYPSSYSNIPHRQVGLVGRATYDWRNRYLAEFNIGYNGSENFAPGKRYGVFPAFSAGWVVSDEPFFKPLRHVVSFMKLRGSYGLVGNSNVGGDRFMYTPDPYVINDGDIYVHGGLGYIFGIDNSTVWKGAYEKALHNADVTWEHAYKQDYGVDINFLSDRLRATFDYYYEHRTDILLIDYTSPSIIGFNMPYTNDGVVNSWGWELSLKWNDKIGQNFRYWASMNLSYNQNRVEDMRENLKPNAYQMAKGHRLGARSMYQFWRYYDENTPALYEQTFGEKFPTQLTSNLRDGDAVYVDLNHDGKIDANDMTRDLGNTDIPRYMIGFNLGFSWKDFSVNTQWTGAWDVSRMISGVFRYPFFTKTSHTQGGLLKYIVDNSWTPDNPSQGAKYPRPSWENWDNNYAESTLYEQDAKYLRLKTLQVAYDFRLPVMKKMGMNQLQLAFSGYNLLTFTPYIWGDPESRATNSPTYPLQRTYMLSLKVGF